MTAIIFAILAYFGWGSGDIFGTISNRKIGSFSTSYWVALIGLLILLAYFPFSHTASIGVVGALISALLGVLIIFTFLAFNEALRIGNPSVVGTITGSFTVVTVILSIIFLGERLSLLESLMIFLTVVGVILCSINPDDIKQKKFVIERSVGLAIFSMMGYGVYFTFIKFPIHEAGWFLPTLISNGVSVVVLLIVAVFLKKKISPINASKNLRNVVWAGLLTPLATFFFNFALEIGQTVIVAPIAGAYPTLFVYLAHKVFKDPLTPLQRLGIGVGLAGIVGLTMASSF